MSGAFLATHLEYCPFKRQRKIPQNALVHLEGGESAKDLSEAEDGGSERCALLGKELGAQDLATALTADSFCRQTKVPKGTGDVG